MNTRRFVTVAAAAALLLSVSLAATPAHSQVISPARGGTGTSTIPSYGQLLVGQGNGTYAPQATSTLGILSGGGDVGAGLIGQFPYYAADGSTLTATSSIFIATSTGNVGIINLTPTHPLDVGGNVALSGNIIDTGGTSLALNISGTTVSRYLSLLTASTGGFIRGYGNSSNSLTLGAGTLDQLSLASNGNVGVKNAAPGYALDVLGDANITGRYRVGGTVAIYVPDQTNFGNSLFIGDGGQNLTPGTGTQGQQNVGVGNQALEFISTGFRNTAIGFQALEDVNTGNSNVGIGYSAASSVTNGNSNLGLGALAIQALNTGSNNVGLGAQAMFSITNGNRNIAIGNTAGRYIADGSTAYTNGNNNIVIGADARMSADGVSNEVVIGYQAIGNGSNSVTLGGSSITKTVLQGNVGIGTPNPTTRLNVHGGGIVLNPDGASKPTCTVAVRGMLWTTFGAAGVADTTEVCRKDAADAYAWAALY